MRHLAWLSGLVLVISCSVDPVQSVDGAATGGQGGDCPRCAGGTNGGAGQGGTSTGSGGAAGDTSMGGSGGGAAGAGGITGTGGGGIAGAGGGGIAGHGAGGITGTGGGLAGQGGGGITGAGGVAGHGGGGQAGHGGSGGRTCAQLETDYSDALATARQCTPGAVNQCQHLVPTSITCTGCSEYVNDVTTIDTIEGEWSDQDCAATPHPCPQIACIAPGSGICAATSGTSGGPNAGASPGGSCANVGVTPAH